MNYINLGMLIFLIVLIGGCSSESAVTYGAVLPLTGPAALIGESQQEGIILAVEEINSNGGLDGRSLEIIFEDSRGDPKTGLSAFNKLIGSQAITTVFSSLSSVSSSIVPVADDHNITLLLLAVSLPNITDKSDYSYRFHIGSEDEAAIMGSFMYSKGIDTTAVLYSNDEFGVGALTSFKETYPGMLSFAEAYELTEADFRTHVIKLLATQPDGIYVIGFTMAVPQFLKQLKEMGNNVPIFANLAMTLPSYRDAAGDAAEGTYYTTSLFDPSSSDPNVQKFIHSYENRFGREPNMFAALAYDATYAAVLSEDSFVGVMGETSILPNRNIKYPLRVVQLKNNSLVQVSP